MNTQTSNNPLTNLKIIFQNRPEILKMLNARELDLSGLESEAYMREQKKRKLYPEPVNFYATGRTGAGKTSLGNALLGSGTVELPPMKATGHQDCTDFVGYFTLASNLQYFDLPGAGSNEDYENINRAALLIEQIEDEFADQEIKPIKEFDFINFSDYETEGIRKETIKVEEWQSQENQRVCSADIILYVVAPHMLLTRDDQKYLAALLKSHKQGYQNPRIIFALNIHRTPTGEIMPTPQNMEDAKKIISKIYLKFYPDSLPSIVEIDSRTGMGINKITELICQILPPEKIGNMQQVLRDELKQFAQKERSRRYRQTLAYIAARLATYPVDTPLGKGIVNEAYAAVCDYGMSVFMEEDARAEMEKALYDLVDAVATQTKTSRTKAIETLVNEVQHRTVKTEKIDGYEPEFENVTTTEDVPDYHEETQKVPRSTFARGVISAAEVATHIVTSPVNLVQGIANLFGAKIADKDFIGNRIHESFEKDSYRNETVIVSSKKQVTRTEQRFKGMKAQKRMVTERVPYVVEKMQKVGEKFVQGGYPVVENLLAIGLAIESASVNSSVNISENFDQIIVSGQQKVKALLGRYEEQINQLAESGDPDSAEAKIIEILKSVLLS